MANAERKRVTRKNPAAVALGRKGGLKGGPARAQSLTRKQLRESAVKAVRTRKDKARQRSIGAS